MPQTARSSEVAAGESAFASLYSEAMQAASRELSQIASADSADPGSAAIAADPMSLIDLGGAGSAFAASSGFGPAREDFSATHDELVHHVAAIRLGQGQDAAARRSEWEVPAGTGATAIPASTAIEQTGGGLSSEVRRLISWLDSHAHLHSTHQCAASVRQAMEAAGMATGDRPPSGDAGDYGPFLLRHGAQVIQQESYEPNAGDIAVFDRTEDHPAGHIQIFDGQRWVSDFVQHTFSPYRDQESTPPVTVYRLA